MTASIMADDQRVSSLSETQDIILCTLMIFSGVLSVFGSSTIVYRVLKNPTGTNSYVRIMLGLSFFDIVASIAFILTPFMLPAETSHRVWASGTAVTCSFLGWMTQLSFAAAAYNAALSFYFVATLRYRVSNDDFAAKYEAYIHVFIVFVYLFTATFGVPFDLYREVRLGHGCWIADVPGNCWVEGGCVGPTIGWFYGGLILMVTFVCLPLNNCLIYLHGRGTVNAGGRGRSLAQNGHLRRLATQCFLYVATFFITYTPQMAIRILGSSFNYNQSREHEIYWLLVLNAMFFPLQGFLNMFVFSRPKWLRLREAGIPIGEALRAACLEADVGNYIEQSVRVASSRAPNSSKHDLHPSKASMPISSPPLASIDESPMEFEETRALSGEDTADFSSETSS